MARRQNLRIFLETDIGLVFTILDSTESQAVDITGWALEFTVKQDVNDDDSDAIFTDTASITGTYNAVIATNTQRATIYVQDNDTDEIIPGNYAWQMKRTNSGNKTVVAYGTITFLKGVHD